MLDQVYENVIGWPVELDLRATGDGDARGPGLAQAHLICTACRQSVYCLAKDLSAGVGIVSIEILAAAVTRHYREAHTDGGGIPV